MENEAYPAFVFEREADAHPAFVQIIRSAVKSIDFRSDEFLPVERQIYHDIARRGFEQHVVPKLNASCKNDQQRRLVSLQLATKLGQCVFNRISRDQLSRFVPFNDVQLLPRGNDIVVQFRSLMQSRGSHGTIYHSALRPTIVVNGRALTVGFARHAIEQTCKRIDPNWLDYAGAGDVFEYFHSCTHFELVKLSDQNPAITFFDECPVGFWRRQYVDRVLGGTPAFDANRRYWFRVGYCPIAINGGFAVATTFLFPGFFKTPEGLLLRRLPASAERERMLDLATAEEAGGRVIAENDFELVRFFHHRGIPQVKCFDNDPYRIRDADNRTP